MFSKVLVKLVDQAIIPALLLFVTRILSLFLISSYYGIDMTLGGGSFVFENQTDYILVNSYSLLSMVVVLSVGLLYVLSKSFLFHDSHIEPSLTAQLFGMRLSSLIQTSFDVYSQGVVWLSYMYLLIITTGLLALFGLAFTWVFAVSLTLGVIATVLLVYDVEREVELNSEPFADLNKEEDEEEEYILTFGGSNE